MFNYMGYTNSDSTYERPVKLKLSQSVIKVKVRKSAYYSGSKAPSAHDSGRKISLQEITSNQGGLKNL